MPSTLSGRDVATGRPVDVRLGHTIDAVEPSNSPDDGTFLAPGFIDLQVNGFAGIDFNSPDLRDDDIAHALDAMGATGVARCFPTVITGAPDAMRRSLARLAEARDRSHAGAAIEGLHVEGPHISPDDGPRGAHPAQWVRAPDLDEFRRQQDAARGAIRLVTLAPEWPGAPVFIEALVADGIVVAIGHTNATSSQIADAVAAGATMSTHLGNGSHRLLPRHPNCVWDQLADDRLRASFIADGIHLPAAFLRAAVRAKGAFRTVLVTDASAPATAAPGRYHLGDQAVDLTPDGRVVLAGQDRLAGSALTLPDAISNVVRDVQVPLAEAVAMATVNAAAAGRIAGRQRGLAVGDRGDLVRFRIDRHTERLIVDDTYVDGRCVFRRPAA